MNNFQTVFTGWNSFQEISNSRSFLKCIWGQYDESGCLQHRLQIALCTVQCAMCNMQWNMQFTLCNVQYAMKYAIYIVQCTMCIVWYAMCTVQCAGCDVYCTMRNLQCAKCTTLCLTSAMHCWVQHMLVHCSVLAVTIARKCISKGVFSKEYFLKVYLTHCSASKQWRKAVTIARKCVSKGVFSEEYFCSASKQWRIAVTIARELSQEPRLYFLRSISQNVFFESVPVALYL